MAVIIRTALDSSGNRPFERASEPRLPAARLPLGL